MTRNAPRSDQEETFMERTGLFSFKGKGLTLVGNPVNVGDKAPEFTALDKTSSVVKLGDFAGKTKVISVTPSLDTAVCDTQLRKFNAAAAALGDDVVVLNVSMDLPPALNRFCNTAGIDKAVTLSDHRDASFGNAYGVLVKELRLLARSVFVIDKDDVVRYLQIVPELPDQPDYDKALTAAK
jgi:thiol peroxidase